MKIINKMVKKKFSKRGGFVKRNREFESEFELVGSFGFLVKLGKYVRGKGN